MSPSPPAVRRALGLLTTRGRRRHGCFLVEGARGVEDALERTPHVLEVIATEATSTDSKWARLASEQGVALHRVADEEFDRISQVVNGQGVLAIVRRPEPVAESSPLVGPGQWCAVVVDGVSDPGNIGTIIRTAEAVGAGSIILAPGSVDPYNPKVVRSALGSLLRCPPRFMSAARIIEKARSESAHIVVLDGGGDVGLADFEVSGPAIFVVGGEAQGVGHEFHASAGRMLRIDLQGEVESLNAAVAISSVLFALRDRSPRN